MIFEVRDLGKAILGLQVSICLSVWAIFIVIIIISGLILSCKRINKVKHQCVMVVRGLPVSPVPPHFFLSLPISLRPFPTSRDVFQPRAILRRPSQTIATIADHRRMPHSLAQPCTASPGLSQRPSNYGRLGTIHGHLYIHTSR